MATTSPVSLSLSYRVENKRFSTLKRTKTGGIQPKLNVACFVQSCFAVADFVIFSNYCLIGTRHYAALLFYNSIHRQAYLFWVTKRWALMGASHDKRPCRKVGRADKPQCNIKFPASSKSHLSNTPDAHGKPNPPRQGWPRPPQSHPRRPHRRPQHSRV